MLNKCEYFAFLILFFFESFCAKSVRSLDTLFCVQGWLLSRRRGENEEKTKVKQLAGGNTGTSRSRARSLSLARLLGYKARQ